MLPRHVMVRWLVGSLLLAAAGLKLYGLSVSAVPPVGWFATPWVQLAAVEWELLLGGWLLSGANPRWSWRAAVATFGGFAGVSAYLGWQGVASCGCFGVIQASPWWAFGVDTAIVVALVVSAPVVALQVLPVGDKYGFAAVMLSVVVAGGVLLHLSHGSLDVGIARLRGDRMATEWAHLDLGTGPSGGSLTGHVRVHNLTDEPIRLCGGTADCSCRATDGLPMVIPANGYADLPVVVKLPDTAPGLFTRRVEVWADPNRTAAVRFVVACRINSDTTP